MSGYEGSCGPGLEKGEGGGKGQQRPKLALGLFGRYVAALLPGGFVASELTLTPEVSVRQGCSTHNHSSRISLWSRRKDML